MKLKPLHDRFIEGLKCHLPGWKFVASNRHFRLSRPGLNLYMHVAFINHDCDFDVTVDVAVEFVQDKRRIGIVGAELGNIEGVGQVRHSVACEADADAASRSVYEHFRSVGLPFLEVHSNRTYVLEVLRQGGTKARLISPIEQYRPTLIAAHEEAENAA